MAVRHPQCVVLGQLVEVLGIPECRVQREEHVEALNPRLVDGDVQESAAQINVGRQVAVIFCRWNPRLFEHLLNLRWPFLRHSLNGYGCVSLSYVIFVIQPA